MRLRSLLAVPTLIWFLLFILIPLVIVMGVSFATRGAYGSLLWQFNLDNYSQVFSTTYFGIFIESLKMALATTLSCLVLGVLITWAIATSSPKWRSFYILALALPFLTNLVIRLYAIRVFVGFDGPLQQMLSVLQIPFDPFALSQNKVLVYYGMVTTYLPFMVLPLYGAFEKFDFSLVEAAQDLGADSWRILWTVIVPNLKKALWSGAILVFIPSLGEYVIPDLLGGAKTMLYGNLITEQFLKARNWPLGSALAVTMMLVLVVLAMLSLRKEKKHGR
ncbi:ABC transporter permease [Bdellovibrio sp. HCB2-146]|uniref:ABC transporter permease n=1 Tax=Bdellovibrio sp. HCB2-146 TaxID=3394362 RepID=UPI0039BCA94B